MEEMTTHEDIDYRCEQDARQWMAHSFPGSKIFENRTQNLAALLKRFYEYGLSDRAVGDPTQNPDGR